jgi:hypothetical protein
LCSVIFVFLSNGEAKTLALVASIFGVIQTGSLAKEVVVGSGQQQGVAQPFSMLITSYRKRGIRT